MKNFLILTNEKKDPGLRISKKIQDYIEKQGGISQRMCDFTRHVQKDMNCITKDTECVIVLGGDGTMLHAARLIVDHDIPMVGVNLGTLGFLTEIELSKLYDGLDGLLNDTFQIEERMMLDGRVIHADHETDHLPALNDVVIARSGFSRIISFRIMVNGKLLDVYEADGIIVSTPTGSLCENNDKFAIDRKLPKIDMGDLLVIHDTGAHGFAMGYNYNGKLKSAEILLKEDGTTEMIRRAETPEDYFATIKGFNF